MGFNIPFYIVFVTNLLTKGPMQIAIFCLFQCFAKKEYQTESKRNETFGRVIFGTNVIQGDLEWTSRNQRGGHEAGRCACPPGGAPTLVGPSQLHRPTSSSYIYIHIPRKIPGEPRNPISTATTFCTHEIPSWGLFRRSAEGEIGHGGLLLSFWTSIQCSPPLLWRYIRCNLILLCVC